MKNVLKFAFLLFYVTSSYAVTQERTSRIVEELEHSTSRGDNVQISPECAQFQQGFPHYRQAKPKSGADLDVCRGQTVEFVSEVPGATFTSQTVPSKSILSLESALSRAPPFFPALGRFFRYTDNS